MNGHLNTQIPQLHVGHGSHHGSLSIFPVWVDAPRITGLEWKTDNIHIAEREGSPVVSELVLHNRASRPVVALEGDLLKGGWQDRMLAASLLLEPFEGRVVSALCVEHGRWGARDSSTHRDPHAPHSPDGTSRDANAHESVGRRSALSVRHGNLHGTDQQGEVWRRIGRYETSLGTTASSSLLDHLDRSQPITTRQLEGQRGVIIGIGGQVVGAEIFGSSTGLRARWQGILSAAALDARLAPARRTTAHDARVFARYLQAMTLEDGGDAGLARAVRSEQGRLRASGIRQAGASPVATGIIHLTAFDDAHPLLENA
jgi:hypothetical protein